MSPRLSIRPFTGTTVGLICNVCGAGHGPWSVVGGYCITCEDCVKKAACGTKRQGEAMRTDEYTAALGEAMFRARYSDPDSEAVDRAWMAISSQDGYRAAIVREQLLRLGYDITETTDD